MTVQYILKEEITCCFFFKLDRQKFLSKKSTIMKLFSINQIVKTWVNEYETYNITSLLRNTLILFKLKLERLHKFPTHTPT